MRLSLLLTCLLITVSSMSQIGSFNTRNWKRNMREFRFGFGATNFLGDLGGRDQIGKGYSLVDLDWASTSLSFTTGYRYRFHPHWAFSSDMVFGMVRGSDEQTQEIIRSNRNLHFRAPIINATQRIEYIFYAYEKSGRRYDLRPRKSMRNYNTQMYLFGGVGGLFFIPQANFGNGWENLRPLKTEGQGYEDGAKAYSNFTLTIPLGFGMRIATGRDWRVGIEATYNATFSDYIDDVSTVYFDPAVLNSEIGPLAAQASNPAIGNTSWFVPGQQRGDPGENDAVLYVNIVFTKNLSASNFRIRTERWRRKTKF